MITIPCTNTYQCLSMHALDIIDACLYAAESTDDEESPTAVRRVSQNSTTNYPVHPPSPPLSPDASVPYIYPPVLRGRSMSKADATKASAKAKEKPKTYLRSDSF